MRTIRAQTLLYDPWPPRPAPVHEIPLLGDQPSMPAQRIRRNDRVQFEQRLASHCLGFPRQQRPLRVGEPDPLSAQPVFKRPVLGLKEFDDDQLVAMNPTSRDHQQKREQRWHGTHATSLSHAPAELLDSTAPSKTVASAVTVPPERPTLAMIELSAQESIKLNRQSAMRSNRMSCAPCQRTSLPNASRCSRPCSTVKK